MSTRITHLTTLPRSIDYWDYYILCRLNDQVSCALQRMEYWDGTKTGGNTHNAQINDQLTETGQQPTQDVSRFVYKSREELAWELIGTCGERNAYECLDFLSNTLHYLVARHNPYKTFDRTLQYEFQETLVQQHLDQLYAIIRHFLLLGRIQRPVLYAIEQLTREGVYIYRVLQKDGLLDGKETLTIEAVAKKLRQMHKQMHLDEEGCKKPRQSGEKKYKPVLPAFLRIELKKDEVSGFSETNDLPLCKNAQSIMPILHNASMQNCTMDCTEMHDALCTKTQTIPVITTIITDSDYNTDEDTDSAHAIASPAPSTFSDEQLLKELRSRGLLPTQQVVTTHLSTPSEQPSTITVDNSQGDDNVHDILLRGDTSLHRRDSTRDQLPTLQDHPSFGENCQQTQTVASLHPIQGTLPDALGVEIGPKAVNIPTPPNKRSETHSSATTSQPHDELTDIDVSQQASGISYSQQEATPKTTISKPSKSRGKPKPEKVVELPALTDEDRARIEEEQVKKAELEARHKGIYTKIVGRRGYELTDRKDIIVEWTHVHKLAGKFNDAQIEAIHKYLFDEDWKFSKTENKYSIGAYLIWKESGRVAQILRERRKQKQTGQATTPAQPTPATYYPDPKKQIEVPEDFLKRYAR